MEKEPGNRSRAVKELHVAPMMAVTYRDFRYLARLLSKRAILWTEMVVDDTLVFGDEQKVRNHHLEFDEVQHPVICQIGSSGFNLEWTDQASKMVEKAGYDEINLNAECPSNKVAVRRQFGAALMKTPEGSAKILKAMHVVQSIPVSIKVRIAIDKLDAEDFLYSYVKHLVEESGCRRFYLHARKVYTDGRYRPLQNRNVPPLNYPSVYRICQKLPDCDFWINGGIKTLEHARKICYGGGACDCNIDPVETGHGQFPCKLCEAKNGSCTAPPALAPTNLRGCLLGRSAMENPAILADVDRYFYGEPDNPTKNRRQVLLQYADYLGRRYPKRCCDSDHRVSTVDLPSIPGVVHDRRCGRCGDGTEGGSEGSTVGNPRMARALLDYALKPVLGMFYGVKGGPKLWRQLCHAQLSDTSLHNCGPSFLLRCAVEKMTDDLLDRDFVSEHRSC